MNFHTDEADYIFQKALKGEASQRIRVLFTAHMLMEMARMSIEDGLVMQIHPGAMRNHNENVFNRFGLDKGADIPIQTEYTQNLYELLNKYGNNPKLSLIVFTLDETKLLTGISSACRPLPCYEIGPGLVVL